MDQLAGVLGHEIGHVVRRHSIKQMQQQQGANIGVTLACVLTSVCNSQAGQAAIQVGGTALFAKFSREDETRGGRRGDRERRARGYQPERHPGDVPDPAQRARQQPRRCGRLVRHAPARGGSHRGDAAMIAEYDPAILRSLRRTRATTRRSRRGCGRCRLTDAESCAVEHLDTCISKAPGDLLPGALLHCRKVSRTDTGIPTAPDTANSARHTARACCSLHRRS